MTTYWTLVSLWSILLLLDNEDSERAVLMIAMEELGRLPPAVFRAFGRGSRVGARLAIWIQPSSLADGEGTEGSFEWTYRRIRRDITRGQRIQRPPTGTRTGVRRGLSSRQTDQSLRRISHALNANLTGDSGVWSGT